MLRLSAIFRGRSAASGDRSQRDRDHRCRSGQSDRHRPGGILAIALPRPQRRAWPSGSGADFPAARFVLRAVVGQRGTLPPVTIVLSNANVEQLLSVEDAIVDDDGTPSDGNSMTRMEIDIQAAGDTTRMILTTHFDSLEGMEQAIAMGVAEGMKAWMSQIDALLAEVAA